MKKLSEKSRKVLRMIYQGLGAATVSLLFQACYGPGPDMDVTIRGTVRSPANEPIPGIKVSVKDLSSRELTDSGGNFYIHVPEMESYKLKFEDIDGAENGSFKTLKKKIALSNTGVSLNIYLDVADEDEEEDEE
jgi:putative lipoprotein (rSAM/lipoprotein system)